jgi:tetratricopeptide (TPR) repeat protein
MENFDYEKAEDILKRALVIQAEDDELNFTLAVVYEKKKQFDEMYFYLKKTLQINPKNVQALNYLGYSYADRGINLDEALDLIKKAIALDPEQGYIIDSLGWVYFKKGMYDEALRAVKKASEIEKDDPVVFEHLGDIYMQMNDSARALDAWGKSLKFHEKEKGLKERVEKKINDISE